MNLKENKIPPVETLMMKLRGRKIIGVGAVRIGFHDINVYQTLISLQNYIWEGRRGFY